jgi:hypothetical protein
LVNLGPPRSSFPLASLFVLLALLASMYSLFNSGGLGSYIKNLAIGTLLLMFVFVFIGDFFASRKGWGQVAFLGIGVLLVIFSDVVMGFFNVRLGLLRLSLGGSAVSWNGSDITFPLLLVFAGFLIWRAIEGDFKNVL